MSLKSAARFIIAFGILFGLLYGFLMPETFTSYKAQTLLVNGPTHPMSDAEIEKALGVGKIDDFIDEEDIDAEDRAEPGHEQVDDSGTEYEYNISSDEESESESDRKHRREGRDKKRDDSSEDEGERRKNKDKLKKK